MPEEIEVDTDKLRETIDEEIERKSGSFLRLISLTTALLAVLAAIGSLRAGATINEALLLKTEATQLQAEASDQWAYYQAKGIKGAIAQGSATLWTGLGKAPNVELTAQAERYGSEQDAIQKRATELERKRDTRSHEADELIEQHHQFAAAVALFQIAIALGAIAALTRARLAWFASILVGASGVVVMLLPMLRAH